MELNLKTKSCLVTGGTRGLGRAICIDLAKEGVNVAVNYRSNASMAQELAKELKQNHGVKAIAVGGDVNSEEDIKNMFDSSIEAFGSLELLVNNSGICPTSMVADMSLEEWNAVLGTNLTGAFLSCRQMVRYLLAEGKHGRIVNVGSQSAINGSKSGKAHYAASKGGLLTFTNSLAKEVSKYGIAVNVVSPGMIYTDMTAQKLDAQAEEYNESIPIGRISTVEEVANAVVFLCSDAAGYMTGSNLDVSGGMIGR